MVAIDMNRNYIEKVNLLADCIERKNPCLPRRDIQMRVFAMDDLLLLRFVVGTQEK